MANPTKEQIVTLLYAWIAQRTGLDFGNYGDIANYRSESRRITRQRDEARQLIRAVELSGITADELVAAFPRAYSGRLTIVPHPKKPGSFALDYCAGQYWPTEYRAAAAAVCASALWTYKRERCMPQPKFHCGDGVTFSTMEEARKYVANPAFSAVISIEERYNGKTAGDWIRSSFRREFGASMQRRWFD